MNENDDLTIDDLALACIARTTYTSESTLWTKYDRIAPVTIAWPCPASARPPWVRLKDADKIVFAKGKGVKQA